MKRKQMIITTVPFLLCITLLIVKMLTPTYVDAQGFLQESFYLIPLAYLSLFGGIALVIFNVVMRKKAK